MIHAILGAHNQGPAQTLHQTDRREHCNINKSVIVKGEVSSGPERFPVDDDVLVHSTGKELLCGLHGGTPAVATAYKGILRLDSAH